MVKILTGNVNAIALRKARIVYNFGLSEYSRINETNVCGFRAHYRIYSAIRRGFHLSRMTTKNLISSM